MIQILTANHAETIMDCFRNAKHEIKIASPYLSPSTADILCDASKRGLKCTFVTRIYTDDLTKRANNIDALRNMLNADVTVYAMIALHAKLYLFDNNTAILGSANFTESGLNLNYELSIKIDADDVDSRNLIASLHTVYSSMINQIIEQDSIAADIKRKGLVTNNLLDLVQDDYDRHYISSKGKVPSRSLNRYGADIRSKAAIEEESSDYKYVIQDIDSEQSSTAMERDVVNRCLSSAPKIPRKQGEHHIWYKQEGTDETRGDGTEHKEMACVSLNGKTVYIANSSKSFAGFCKGDDIYIVNQSRDREGNKQRIIVGHGIARGYMPENIVLTEWYKEYPWMEKHKYYCIIDDLTILDTACMNGIRFDEITQKLGSNAFVASYGRNESPRELEQKWCQQSYLEASQEAKDLIDKKLCSLEKKYGVREYKSE